MDHRELRQRSADYALGMLGDEERRQLEVHLDGCEECARAVADAMSATGALGLMVDQVEPPPSLRARVLAAAAGPQALEPQRPHAAARARASGAPAWLALAASLAAVALGIYSWHLRGRVESLEGELRAARSAAADQERTLVSLRADADRAQAVTAILGAGDLQRVDLQAAPPAADAAARALWSPSRGLVFAASGLPRAPAGRAYQLWIVTDNAPVSMGLLSPDDAGLAAAVAPVPAGVRKVVAVAVTLEPAGGVPAPTGPKVLIGML